MLERGDAFIDYAHAAGATVAGATDTQGEAPKYWVVEDGSGAWHPDDGESGGTAQRHALLKLPVPEAGPRATDMLRTEAAYQRVARAVGLRVTAQLPEFIGEKALLVPRFDRRTEAGHEVRLGVESLYSIVQALDADAPLQHHTILIELSRHLTDYPAEMLEYIRRDVFNIALGNRDNHGRNTAVLKDTDGSLRLAPLYDVGPSFLDARAIARRIRWDGEELGAQIDWRRVLANLRLHFEEAREARLPQSMLMPNLDATALSLKSFAPAVRALPDLMRQSGVDESIVQACTGACQRMAAALDAIPV
jgi:serine/threonine-protein kinase HipA